MSGFRPLRVTGAEAPLVLAFALDFVAGVVAALGLDRLDAYHSISSHHQPVN